MATVENESEATGSCDAQRPSFGLTARELSVLTQIVGGYSHKEIADTLGIALGTVNVFVHRIRLKTKSKSRRDLILAAAQYGICVSDNLQESSQHAQDLTLVEEAWPNVPGSVRAAILSLVQAVGNATARPSSPVMTPRVS